MVALASAGLISHQAVERTRYYADYAHLDADACGEYRPDCWWAIRDLGYGPLVTDPRTGTTRLRALHCLLWNESRLNPRIVNTRGNDPPGSRDRGIAQINSHWNAHVTDAQAFNPSWAIRWTARHLFPTARVTWHAFEDECRA